MPKHLIRPCPICGTSKGEVLHSVHFKLIEGIPLTDSYDVVLCALCHFAFADTASQQADYDRYYNMHSKYEDKTIGTGTGGASSPIDDKRLRVTAEHVATHMGKPNARVADIGCANGGLLAALQVCGYTDLTGIDPSPGCVRNVAARPGIKAIVGTFSKMPVVEKPFDLVIFTGVLEHVRDIADIIRALEEVLTPDGYVYLSVPDAARYCEFPEAPFQEFNIEHINHFTVRSLTNFMQMSGYRPVVVEQQTYDPVLRYESLSVLGLFQRTGTMTAPTPDLEIKAQLQRYIDDSQAGMDFLEKQLATIFAEHDQLILWGTGQLALKMLCLPAVDHTKIKAFVDGNPINHGKHLLGKPILAPDAIKTMREPILLTTTLHQAPIERTIREQLQMHNPILTLRSH